MIQKLSDKYSIISRESDQLYIDENKSNIRDLLKYNYDFIIIIPYISPPLYSVRYDGEISICIFNKKKFDIDFIATNSFSIQNFIYNIVYNYFRDTKYNNYKVVQLGKENKVRQSEHKLSASKIIIPHKGNISLLERCLYFLQNKENPQIPIDIVFDSFGYKKAHKKLSHFNNLFFYKNCPLEVGPYPGRHYSILKSEQEFIFFQDSDDISTSDRFQAQLDYMLSNNLDMVGSHELRIDQFSKTMKIIRFPIDVSKALKNQASHPLFHPTSLIRKSKYIESLGFSLNRKFGSDTQFLLRAYFFMKIANVDEFYYIRFKRQNSLTTNSKTHLNSEVRIELDRKWKIDFEDIKKGEKVLSETSLAFEKFPNEYELVKLNYS